MYLGKNIIYYIDNIRIHLVIGLLPQSWGSFFYFRDKNS